MNSQNTSIFTQVRSKLRHSQSNLSLSPSPPTQSNFLDWDNIPMAYHPLERTQPRVVNGYYMGRPLPGPPPRPRSVSPMPTFEPSASLDFGNLRIPTPRTQRSRSAQGLQSTWQDVQDNGTDLRNKVASNALTVAPSSENCEPPPPYSRYPPPPPPGLAPRPHSLPPQPVSCTRPYNPNDYVSYRNDSITPVPTIGHPHPPTPVSPINTLDLQYLAMRQHTRHVPTANGGSVTIDSLLSHPMLQHSDEVLR